MTSLFGEDAALAPQSGLPLGNSVDETELREMKNIGVGFVSSLRGPRGFLDAAGRHLGVEDALWLQPDLLVVVLVFHHLLQPQEAQSAHGLRLVASQHANLQLPGLSAIRGSRHTRRKKKRSAQHQWRLTNDNCK